MAKFKVGDRVRVHYIPYYSALPKKYIAEQEFIIDRIAPPRYRYDESIYRLKNEDEFCWSEKELELVKPKFDHNNYKSGKYVMHVTTKEEDKIFRIYLDKVGKEWASGDSYTEWEHFDIYGDATCYNFIQDVYCSKGYYMDRNYTILEFNDFDWSNFEMKKEFTKKDLKEFDIVKTRRGDVFMVLRNRMSREGLSIFNKAHWGCHNHMDSYSDNLTHKSRLGDDIVAVKKFEDDGLYTLLDGFFNEGRTKYDWDWERKEVEEMTLEEVCKALGKEIKIVKK